MYYEFKLLECGCFVLFFFFRDVIFFVSIENNNKGNFSIFLSCFLIVSYSCCFKFLILLIRLKGVLWSFCCGIS